MNERPRFDRSQEPAFLPGTMVGDTTLRDLFFRGKPSNAGELFVQNADLVNDLWVGYGTPGGAVDTSSMYRIPPGQTHVFRITAPLFANPKTLVYGCIAGTVRVSIMFDASYEPIILGTGAVIA